MNKRVKIITINGLRGMFFVVFIIFGLVSGFILSPAWLCMKLWNTFVSGHISSVSMNYYQGLLLWAIIALSFYAINNKKSLIGFGSYSGLTPEQIRDIIKKSKMPNFKNENINQDKLHEQDNNINNDKIIQGTNNENNRK